MTIAARLTATIDHVNPLRTPISCLADRGDGADRGIAIVVVRGW